MFFVGILISPGKDMSGRGGWLWRLCTVCCINVVVVLVVVDDSW